MRLRRGAASAVNHLHINHLLHAGLAHCHGRTPWVFFFTTAIRAFSVPLVVLQHFHIVVIATVDIGLVCLDGRQSNDTIAIGILRLERLGRGERFSRRGVEGRCW